MVAHEACTGAQLIVEAITDAVCPFCNNVVGLVVIAVARISEKIAGGTNSIAVFVAIIVLIAQCEVVGLVDIPVDAARNAEAVALNVAWAETITNARQRIVAVHYLLCHIR